jgi:membrane-associated phospholipid phosphatase
MTAPADGDGQVRSAINDGITGARDLVGRVQAPLLARAPWKDRLADWVSLAPAACYIALLALLVATRDPYYIVIAVGMTTIALAVKLTKAATRPFLGGDFADWLARPSGARGCGALNGEDCDAGEGGKCPGMPSGHQAVIAFFVFSMIFYHRLTVVSAPLWIALLALNFAVGVSRVYKECHTIPQVVAGSVVGILIAVAFYQVISPPFRLE